MGTILSPFANDYEYLIRIFLALLFGGLIGIEREVHGRAAGFRTNILVCLGAAAIMVAFQKLYVTSIFGVESAIRMDPARAAAGVITGIGFLGAGTIIKSEEFIRGLTTAASIWVVSAIGITLGLGEYTIAVTLAALVLFSLYVLHKLKFRAFRYAEIGVEGSGDLELYRQASSQIEKHGLTIKDYRLSMAPHERTIRLDFIVSYKGGDIGPAVLDTLSDVEGTKLVTWK